MMIHEKIVPGQFLLDLKNERASLLNNSQQQHPLNEIHPQHHQQQAALASHYLHLNHQHHHHHHQQQLARQTLQHQPPSPPMDIYTAYAYQHQQQELLKNLNIQHINNTTTISHDTNDHKAEVLDLSRRCDSVETPRKTPSPSQTNSSIDTASPVSSPQQSQAPQPPIPSNLLFSSHAQEQKQQHIPILPAALSTLYPGLYYNNNIIKPESKTPSESPNKTPPLPTTTSFNNTNKPPTTPTPTNLLHTFATATKTPSSTIECKSPSTTSRLLPQTNLLTTLEEKNTRPFKALPRDPLVIAANFAATDVLFENDHAERYKEFRKRLLEHIHNSNGGSRTVTNPKMRRTNSRSVAGSVCRSSSEERLDDHHSSKTSNNGADDSSDCESNAGSLTDKMISSNPANNSMENFNNNNSSSCGSIVKDAAYLERRRKNNAAAKKSRDRRRMKEDELAMRAEFLTQVNRELECQIKALKAQLAAYTSKAVP